MHNANQNVKRLPGITIKVGPRVDRHRNVFNMGRTQFPGTMHFKKGVAFFFYPSQEELTPEEIEEGRASYTGELRIAMARPGSECMGIRKKLNVNDNSVDRYVIELERRMPDPEDDPEGRPFYMGLVQDDSLVLDLDEGYVFFIFTNEEGYEELHIAKNDERNARVAQDREVGESYQQRPRGRTGFQDRWVAVRPNRRNQGSGTTEVVQNGETRTVTRPGY